MLAWWVGMEAVLVAMVLVTGWRWGKYQIAYMSDMLPDMEAAPLNSIWLIAQLGGAVLLAVLGAMGLLWQLL